MDPNCGWGHWRAGETVQGNAFAPISAVQGTLRAKQAEPRGSQHWAAREWPHGRESGQAGYNPLSRWFTPTQSYFCYCCHGPH